ncbi:MAG: CPBP family intramembrane metalloprotease [Halanaerobiales bacterium]|nr:CPBP family intramembrane metalloprotease [Halanaerobiales bacterium]
MSKLIDIKNVFLIMFFVFLEEIYFRIFTLSFFVYFFNSELSAIIITSIIFSFYHVDKVKYTNKINYFIKMFDLFVFSIILSAVFILIKNFWIIFFIHFFRNIILTGVSIKSLSDSK